jgi:hypothetical protein
MGLSLGLSVSAEALLCIAVLLTLKELDLVQELQAERRVACTEWEQWHNPALKR